MKKGIIIGLVALNLVLLWALAFTDKGTTANGQAMRGNVDYLVSTGKFNKDYDALYVIDLAKRRMCFFLLDPTTRKLSANGARKLRADFPANEPR
jgi:hypothetical protein